MNVINIKLTVGMTNLPSLRFSFRDQYAHTHIE